MSNEYCLFKCYKLVEDLREQIVMAKMEGEKILAQKTAAAIEIRKNEILRERRKQEEQEKIEKRKQLEREYQERQSKIKPSKETIERRKKLNLVGYDNPNAKNHPGNIMVYSTQQKDEDERGKEFREYGIRGGTVIRNAV